MLCAILKKRDEISKRNVRIEISVDGGLSKIRWPKAKPPKSLVRLCEAPWTRNDAHGYVRDAQGELWQIDALEFSPSGARVTGVFLMPVSENRKFSAYCKCGGAMKGSVRSKDEKSFQKCIEVFWTAHVSAGCGPTDAVSAARARRKSERKETLDPK
jgi:hypothetical protein